MIAIDTSSLARFLDGIEERDTLMVEAALRARAALLPPVVLVEILSNPLIPDVAEQVIRGVPLLEVQEGYWERAGQMRSRLLQSKYKSAIADCLIAQSCIDNDVALITWDRDYGHFRDSGLKLL
jgi:predicted nucleic acid-binding protein